MPDHIFTSSSGFRQISFTVRTFSRSLRFFARICTLLFQHSHHHDCHKQHAHAPDKDIDRPDRHVDLIVHALLDGSVFQPLILLLKPFIFFSDLPGSFPSRSPQPLWRPQPQSQPPPSSPSLLPSSHLQLFPDSHNSNKRKHALRVSPCYRDSHQGPAQAWTLARCSRKQRTGFGTHPPPVLSNCLTTVSLLLLCNVLSDIECDRNYDNDTLCNVLVVCIYS